MVAAECADDAHGHRLADPIRVADREGDIPDARIVGDRQGGDGQVIHVDFKYSQVRIRVGPDQMGNGFAAVTQGDLNFVGALDDMVVGQYISLVADNNARAQARQHALTRWRPLAEKPLDDCRIHCAGVCFFNNARRIDIDDRGGGALDGTGVTAVPAGALQRGAGLGVRRGAL